MRDAFGRKAASHRAAQNLSLRRFAQLAELSPAQVSNIENGREAASDRVISRYIKALNLNGEDAHELRQLAQVGATVRSERLAGTAPQVADLVALMKLFGSDFSKPTLEKFKTEIERELGFSVGKLFLRIGNRQAGRAKRESAARSQMGPRRLAALAWIGICIRRGLGLMDTEKLQIYVLLDRLTSQDPHFNYEVVQEMPEKRADAFAFLKKGADSFTLYLKETMLNASSDDPYFRYVVTHEIAHYILHRHLFTENAETVPRKERNDLTEDDPTTFRKQVIESLPEVDADALAVFMQIPWERFLSSLTLKEIAKDYRFDTSTVVSIGDLFRQKSVYEELAYVLWELGERKHPVFNKLNEMGRY